MTRWIRWQGRLLPVAALVLSVTGAAAQAPLKAWPDQQQPQQRQQPAWPSDAQPSQPASAQPAPMAAPAPAPMMGSPAAPGMGGFGAAPPPQQNNPCMAEFSKLRGDVEKAGKVAKAVNDRKGTREEFCKAITGVHSAQVRWVKYTQDHAKQCGIPPDIITQLKAGQTHLGKLRHNICSGEGAAAAPAPSLSEALGTSRMPAAADEAPRKRGGSLDTLTGQSIR